jgi:hypothetical protein
MTPMAPKGHEQAGRARLQIALRSMEDSLPLIGSHTPLGKAVLKAIHALVKEVGGDEEHDQAITPAQIKNTLTDKQGPPAAGPPAGQGPGGLPPGAAPPGPGAPPGPPGGGPPPGGM